MVQKDGGSKIGKVGQSNHMFVTCKKDQNDKINITSNTIVLSCNFGVYINGIDGLVKQKFNKTVCLPPDLIRKIEINGITPAPTQQIYSSSAPLSPSTSTNTFFPSLWDLFFLSGGGKTTTTVASADCLRFTTRVSSRTSTYVAT